MKIDFHTYTGKSLFGMELSEENLSLNMNRLGIDQAVLLPFKPPEYHFEPENNRVAALVKKYPGKYNAFGRVDPWRGEYALSEIDRIFCELGLDGLFINPAEEQCPLTSPAVRKVVEKAAGYGKPIMIAGGHTRVSHPRQMEYLAKEFPDTSFIVTSSGQINICGIMMADAEDMLSNCPNVTMETSGIYRRDFIERMTDVIGSGRILFGSGSPYFNQEFELERITGAYIKDEARTDILCNTALNILKK
ncbi:MAG: amidohydrolase family protein [Firmicutes bacterium]|nr:amidohydrolase family protein [Bacillota bacterium]